MARLPFAVTSEIKYTEQHCYNKERKTTSCQFYLITKKTTTLQEYTIAWKKYMYIKQYFNIIYSLRDLQYKIVMEVLPTNNLLVNY